MNKTDTLFDVAVIGAGPAGATFIRELATKCPSLKTVIVDKKINDNAKVCGGLLSPDAQKILARLDMTLPKRILSDPQIFTVETIDLSSRQKRYYQRNYLNMNRGDFDNWLFSLIPESVSKIFGRCTRIERSDKTIHIEVSTQDGIKSFSARYLVGADGASSVVRKCFFSDDIYHYVAIQQHFRDCQQDLPSYSCIFDRKTSDSCSWTIKKDGEFIFGGAFNIKNCKEKFEEQKRRFEKYVGHSLGEATKTEACLLSSPRRASNFKASKNNVYLIGEAAGFISASSFEGISYAILSGKLLADAFYESRSESEINKKYKLKIFILGIKLCSKIIKRHILCSPLLRYIIMKSGIASIKKYK